MLMLVNPPNPPGAVSNKDTMGGLGQLYAADATMAFPPLDLLYAAGLLRSQGVEAELVECLGLGLETAGLVNLLADKRPEMVAIRTSTPTVDWDLSVARVIKLALDTRVVVFGPQVTLNPQPILASEWVDAVLIGEPEQTLLELGREGSFDGIAGVWHKQGGEIIRGEQRPAISELDTLPFPAWDLVPYRRYQGGELMRDLSPFVTTSTSRGCPYSCSYCPYPVTQGRKSRQFSVERVVDELAWLSRDLGVRSVLFRDPEFGVRRERVVELCESLLKQQVSIGFRCETRIEDLDAELIALLARAGCVGINLGFESGEPAVLKNVDRKPFPHERARELLAVCRQHGLSTFGFFILGLPGDTRESCLRTIQLALKIEPSHVQFCMATPYPGTALGLWAEQRGFVVSGEASGLTSYDVSMRNEALSVEELVELQWLAHEAWEMRGLRVGRRMLGRGRSVLRELERWLSFRRRWRGARALGTAQ